MTRAGIPRTVATVATVATMTTVAIVAWHGLAPARARADSLDVLRRSEEPARSQAELLAEEHERRLEEPRELVATPLAALQAAELFLRSNLPDSFDTDVSVTASLGSQERAGFGDLAVMARARLTGDLCDIVELGALARASGSGGLGAGASGNAEAQAWGSVCLPRGLAVTGEDADATNDPDSPLRLPSTFRIELFPMRFSGRLSLNVAPSFIASRTAPRQVYSEAGYGFAVEGARFSSAASGRGLSFIFMSFQQRWQWVGALGETEPGYELFGEVAPVRLYKVRGPDALADRAIDFFAFRIHGSRRPVPVGLIDVYPVRFSGISLHQDRVLLDAAIGLVTSGGTIESSDGGVIMPGPDTPEVVTAGGELGISVGDRAQSWGVRGTRGLDTTFDGQVTLETRATAWAETSQQRWRASGEVFGGGARHFLDRRTAGRERFAGTSATVEYALDRGFWLGLRMEGLSSFARDPVLEGAVGTSAYSAVATLSYARRLSSQALQ